MLPLVVKGNSDPKLKTTWTHFATCNVECSMVHVHIVLVNDNSELY